jgi:hypothetical protein
MRISSLLGLGVSGFVVLNGCRADATDDGAEPGQAAATLGLPQGFAMLAPVSGDAALSVVADGPQRGLRITPLNPAPGVGPQPPEKASDLCSLLDFAGETGWRLLSRSEAQALERLEIVLVPGYGGGEAWVQVTKQEKSDEIANAEADLPPSSSTAFVLARQVMLISLGFARGGAPDEDRFVSTKADLAKAISTGHGGDRFELAHWDITRNMTDPQFDMATTFDDPFGVICAKH